MEITAKSAKFENDGYCTVLAFADDPLDPRHYVILQITNNPSPQDMKLGQGGIHFEFGGQEASGYDLVKAIEAFPGGVLLTIEEGAARRIGIDTKLTIKFERGAIENLLPEEAIQVFQARLPHG